MAKRKKVNKKYKDTMFRMLFGKDRNELLNLYNAVNGTDYTNAEDLMINTLEDAVYVSMKNDVSFVFQDYLSLYEHQSTLNPNIPLRDLFYVSDLLQEMSSDMNLYGKKRLSIPAPHFIVFYNGTENTGDTREYRLSELFTKKDGRPQLELIVRIININDGQNNKVLKGCKTLREYASFVAMVRKNQETMETEHAVTKAVDDCINQGILKAFLLKHKAKVINMSIYEYDEKKQRDLDREEGREEGRREGLEEGKIKGKLELLDELINDGTLTAEVADKIRKKVSDL